MLLKVLELDGVKHIASCLQTGPSCDWDRELSFYCHNEAAVQSFMEVLSFANFQLRLKNLNARVKFPESAVRAALETDEPAQASLAEPNPAGVRVLSLKYLMAGTPAPLKWEWHLKPMATAQFYRELLVNAMNTGEELLDLVSTLTTQLCAKDKELEQYRREGFQLRRTTVKTKAFDLQDFNEVNGEVMKQAAAYRKLNEVFPNDTNFYSLSRDVPSTPSTPSASSNASERPSPSSGSSSARYRKRRAQESNTNHLERKVIQRRNQPQIEYKNSQSSQEEALLDWLTENKPPNGVKQEPEPEAAVKSETDAPPRAEATIKTEIASEPEEIVKDEKPQPVKDSLVDSDQELNELRAILGHTMGQKLEKRQ